MEDDAVHVLPSGQNLREAPLDILIHLPALFSAVNQLGDRAGADLLLLVARGSLFSCTE